MNLPVGWFASGHERVRICANRMARCSTSAAAYRQDAAGADAGKSRRKKVFSARRRSVARPRGARLHAPCCWLRPEMGMAVRAVPFRLAMTAALILSLIGRKASPEPLNWADLLATQTPEAAANSPPVLPAPATPAPRRTENSGVTASTTPSGVPQARRRGTAEVRTPFKPSLQEEFPHVRGAE